VKLIFTLFTGHNSLLGEEQKLHKGQRHEYHIENTGYWEGERGIKQIKRNNRR